DLAETFLREAGCEEVWSITNVGFGPRSTICFPDQPPTDNVLQVLDVGHVDVHPVAPDGWRGDCTRTFLRGRDPAHARALATVREIHAATLARCTPGMRACDLFAGCLEAMETA